MGRLARIAGENTLNNELKCNDIPIESLNVDEQCLAELKKEGISTVGELMGYFEQFWGGRSAPIPRHSRKFFECTPEFVNCLKEIDCWPHDLK